MKNIPLALTLLRLLLAPALLLITFHGGSHPLFGLCLVVAFLSDVFDGIIARRLRVATPALRRLDSVVDSVFYLTALYCAWRLHPSAIVGRAPLLWVLASMELVRYVFDWCKFRREAAYHLWLSKLWGIALFTAFFLLLADGSDTLLISVAIYLGIIADTEGLIISMVLPRWQADVPTLRHALRLRRAMSS